MHLLSFRNCMKLSAKRCELVQLMQKYVPRSHVGIFLTNTPNPLHWTLNSCFGVLHSVWVHLGSFSNYMKLDAKQGELVQLMQKFLPRSHVEIFLNERTQYTPLDPKLMLPYETRCTTGRTSAKVRATKSRRNFSQRTHPIHPIGP